MQKHELPRLVRAVVRATASYDVNVVAGGVGTYLVARAARKAGLKVLLSGEGSDELFGGYAHFRQMPAALLEGALLRHQADLGATECMRLDRATMAHGVEARVPFLSSSVVACARGLGASEKIRDVGGRVVDKYVLRTFAAGLLPEEIAFRTKIGFGEGSGVEYELQQLAETQFCGLRRRANVRGVPEIPDL